MYAQKIIDSLPDQAKRNVLFSLVGSLNASVVGTASSVVARLSKGDYDFRELEARDVVTMLNEMDDRADLVLNARRTVRVARALRDQLIVLSNNDEDGDIGATLDFMSKASAKPIDAKLLKATLEAAGIVGVDTAHFDAMNRISSEQRAARLSEQRGAIEWLIEHVFTARGYDGVNDEGRPEFTDESDADEIECLSAEQREKLYDKLQSAISRARDTTVLGVLNKDRRYSFGDLPLITAALKDAEQLDAHVTH
jgi:hypothetical protein